MISYYYITDIWTQVFVVMLNFKNRRIFKFRRQFLDTDDVCPSQLPCQMHKMSANVRWLCVSYRFRILILTTNLYRKYTNNRFSRAFIEKRNLLPRNLRACHLIPHKQHEAFNVTNEHVSSVFSTCRQRMEDGTPHETL